MDARSACTLLLLILAGCGDDPLTRLTGNLEVTAINAHEEASRITVLAQRTGTEEETRAPVERPATVLLLGRIDPGTWDVRVDARDVSGVPLQAVWVEGVEVPALEVSELLVDLSTSPIPPPAEICDGEDNDGDGEVDEALDIAVCAACDGGREVLLRDDERCGSVRCDELDYFEHRGIDAADAEGTCVAVTYTIEERCEAVGRCAEPNSAACRPSETIVATAGLCHTMSEAGCVDGEPVIEVAPDGTPCGAEQICEAGACVPLLPPDPEVGCADGEREGYLSLSKYPNIAGCSGGWSQPGVTSPLAPGCGRTSGDDSANPTGQGCSALDLCAEGWHVCDGKAEVAQRSPDGCTGAVPPGTPNKSLFFAVHQTSLQGSTCTDDGTGDNDVFGCGNLGNALSPDKNCGPLDRVLASTQPNSCGFNEAEPPLGPWECAGGPQSHLHEGANVTKKACANADCSYDGNPIGSWDKGGVLCCR